MTDLPLFLKSSGVGLAVAVPVGPMSLLCMRRTLARGWRPGLATGLGIAAGDGAFASVAALSGEAMDRPDLRRGSGCVRHGGTAPGDLAVALTLSKG